MIMIRLGRIRLALQGIAGGRHARRPCFDFETPTCRDSLNIGRLHDITCPVDKGLARLVSPGSTHIFKDIGIARVSTIVMALNKLSINKVELENKRVLIRYVL